MGFPMQKVLGLAVRASRAGAGQRVAMAQHIGATHLGPVHPDQRDPDHAIHQHEGAGAHARDVEQGAEQDGQHEAAQAAGQADDAADGADVVRVVVGDVLEDAGLAEGPRHAQHGHDGGEGVDVQADVEGLRALDGVDGEVGLRVGQDGMKGRFLTCSSPVRH